MEADGQDIPGIRSFSPIRLNLWTGCTKHGYKITLNVHPADGVRAYEEAYPRVAEKMGIDPASKEPVLFGYDRSEIH